MKSGFCWNSRRWLFRLLPETAPLTCKYREQGNIDCVRGGCAYYEERKMPRRVRRDWDAFAAWRVS